MRCHACVWVIWNMCDLTTSLLSSAVHDLGMTIGGLHATFADGVPIWPMWQFTCLGTIACSLPDSPPVEPSWFHLSRRRLAPGARCRAFGKRWMFPFFVPNICSTPSFLVSVTFVVWIVPHHFHNKRTLSEGDCGPVALLVLGHVHSTTCRTHIFLSPHHCTLLHTCFVLCVAHVTTITVAEGRVKAQDVFVTIAVCFITKRNPHCFMSLIHPLGFSGPAHLPLTFRTPSAPKYNLADSRAESCRRNSAGRADVWPSGQPHSSHRTCPLNGYAFLKPAWNIHRGVATNLRTSQVARTPAAWAAAQTTWRTNIYQGKSCHHRQVSKSVQQAQVHGESVRTHGSHVALQWSRMMVGPSSDPTSCRQCHPTCRSLPGKHTLLRDQHKKHGFSSSCSRLRWPRGSFTEKTWHHAPDSMWTSTSKTFSTSSRCRASHVLLWGYFVYTRWSLFGDNRWSKDHACQTCSWEKLAPSLGTANQLRERCWLHRLSINSTPASQIASEEETRLSIESWNTGPRKVPRES